MCDDAHRVEQLAAEKFEARDAEIRVVREILLEHEEVVRQPDAGIARKDCFHVGDRVDHLDARAAASLIRLQQCGPADIGGVGVQGLRVVERDRTWTIDTESAEERSLRALAQFERKDIGTVEDTSAEQFERAHVGERQRDGARVPTEISAGARLVEVERGTRDLDVAERRAGQVERLERHAAAPERGKERLLPLGMLVENDEIRRRPQCQLPAGDAVTGTARTMNRFGAGPW